MTNRKGPTAGIFIAALLLLAGCAFPETSTEKAAWFFGEGREIIIESLEDQGVGEDQIDRVKGVIAEHKPGVVEDLAEAFSRHRENFKTLYAGQDTEALLAAEDRFHSAQRQALRSIGAMHADIEETVGAETWAAANEQRRKRFEEKFED